MAPWLGKYSVELSFRHPCSGGSLTFLPGSTGKIEWSFDDNISDVFSRSWAFTSTDGSFKDKTIATVSDDDNPKIRVSFPVIAVEKPATLVLKNVDHRYDGKYEFRVQSSTESSSEVTVFMAGLLPSTMLPSSTIMTSEITSPSQTVTSSDISSTSSLKGSKFVMTSFGFMNLFGLICLIFPCQGVIYPPSSGNSLTFPPGSTGKIEWSFDDNISDVFSRSWSFTSTDGSVNRKVIATVSDDDDPKIRVSFPVIEVEKPATLVLNNVDRRYDGKYEFHVSANVQTSSEVTVFIAEKPNVTLNCSSPVSLLKGDNFTCLCRGEGGNPPANVTWFKNGEKFTDVGTEMQTLNLLNVSREDDGTYMCEATSYPHKNYTDKESIQVTVYFHYREI
ncbi:uncharacterized protein LOC114522774 [Dendronephthya gigantea]|uniref:uncharacterized protein LOC114522774 n=1 Tax=Dendronephthya gigantea TaxID=151771 RepID=UPI00106914F4|nr:uncharacterized protein LOC114522774 [Dendronephthya gigantea]